MLQEFNYLFGNKYILPIINKTIYYYEVGVLYLFNILKISLVWYTQPIELKYSIKFKGYNNFTEFYIRN